MIAEDIIATVVQRVEGDRVPIFGEQANMLINLAGLARLDFEPAGGGIPVFAIHVRKNPAPLGRFAPPGQP